MNTVRNHLRLLEVTNRIEHNRIHLNCKSSWF